MEQEVNLKIACIAIQTTETASRAFIKALEGFTQKQMSFSDNRKTRVESEHKETEGRMVKVKDLRKDGSQIEFVDMGNDELTKFRKYARRNGVSYSMEKNNETDPPTYLIYFKAKDSVLINKAIKEYVNDKYKEAEKDKDNSLTEKLAKAKEKSKTQPKKVRNKEKIR